MDLTENMQRIHCRPAIQAAFSLLIGLSLLSAGCGGGGGGTKKRKTTAVSGTVKLKGQPLADAGVYFAGDGFTGFGKTDANGAYRLAQGAVPGMNKVFISKQQGGASPAGADPTATLEDPGQMEAAAQGAAPGANASRKAGPKELIPADYSSEKTTKLTFEVPENGAVTDADFDL